MIADLLSYYAVLCLGALFRALPPRWALFLGATLGELGHLLRLRRGVVLHNLEIAFPDKSEEERRRIARGAYREAGRNMAELVRSPSAASVEQAESVRIVGAEHLDQALSLGRGALVVAGHYGSWDAAGAVFSRHWPSTWVVIRHQKNILMEAIYERTYLRRGYGVIKKKRAVAEGYEVLNKGAVMVLLADQHAGGHGVFLPFFRRMASTPKGPALFSYRSGAPMIYARVERRSDPLRRDVILEPLPRPDPRQDEELEIRRLTAAFLAKLEESIRARPDHYFWFHKRWKSLPKMHKIEET